jgi:hypothetical protein
MTTTVGKKRNVSETAGREDDAAKKAKTRREEETRIGEEVLKTVRRSYFDDTRQASVIYDVWATVLCGNTFAKCISDASTMDGPADARGRAIQEIKAQHIDGAATLAASAKRFLADLFETRIDSAPAALPTSAVVDEVRVEVDIFTGAAAGPAITPWATTVPQTQMVFVCKYTGATLGRTGDGFAFADVVAEPATVKDQWSCILNFLRAHVALFTKSKFFDIKKNTNRAKALAAIEHAVNCAKTQLGANIEDQYEAASAAAGSLLDGLRAKRDQLCMPSAVDDTRAAYDAAEERLLQHDAKYKHLFSLTADDDDIEREMDSLRRACTKKRGSIDAEVATALAAYNDAKVQAANVIDEMAKLDASILEAGDHHKRKLDGRFVEAMVQRIAEDFIEKQYYQPFRDLLYLFDEATALPALLGQLRRICSLEVVRAEACFAFVIGVNKHFRGGGCA